MSSYGGLFSFYCTSVWRADWTRELYVCSFDMAVLHVLVRPNTLFQPASLLPWPCKIDALLCQGLKSISYDGFFFFFCLWINTIMVTCDVFYHFASYFQINTHNGQWLPWLRRPAKANISSKEWVCLNPFSPTQMESINNCFFFSNND